MHSPACTRQSLSLIHIYIELFEGASDVYIAMRNTGKLVRTSAKYRVEVNRSLLTALEKLLGEENVAFRGQWR